MSTQRRASRDLLVDLGAEQGPLHRRLTIALRAAIHQGRLTDGDLLPPSRTLASQLGISRWVVNEAYTQLAAEGYVEARTGSGTRVRAVAATNDPPTDPAPSATFAPARYDLAPGIPDLRTFPRSRWLEAYRLALLELAHSDLVHTGGVAWPPAVAAVTGYLQRARGVVTPPAHVALTRGATAATAALARTLAASGHRAVAVEDPSWSGLRDSFRDAGMRVVPVPVDDQGLHVDQLWADPAVRLVIVTPAHQFPTGVALSPDRRRELLHWATTVEALIIEDDYDAEFRYDHRPVASLQGMAPDRVVMLGSVSKTLAPALEIGWAVLPGRLPSTLNRTGPAPPLFEQAALSTMISRGWYERHLVQARRRYRHRRQLLLDALQQLTPALAPRGLAAGLHLVLPMPSDVNEQAVVAAAADLDLRLTPAGRYRVRASDESGGPDEIGHPALILGYGNLRDGAQTEAVRRLQRAITIGQTNADQPDQGIA